MKDKRIEERIQHSLNAELLGCGQPPTSVISSLKTQQEDIK